MAFSATPEQYAQWSAEADAIQAGRDYSSLSEGERASIMAIRSMGPDAAAVWMQANLSMFRPITTVVNENNVAVPITSLPPAQVDYYLQQNQQRQLDAQQAMGSVNAAIAGAGSAAPSPAPRPADAPATVNVVGTMAATSAGGTTTTTAPLSTALLAGAIDAGSGTGGSWMTVLRAPDSPASTVGLSSGAAGNASGNVATPTSAAVTGPATLAGTDATPSGTGMLFLLVLAVALFAVFHFSRSRG